jgi:hypothetical protein
VVDHEAAKTVMDGVAVSGGIASLAGWLPDAAAGMTILWLALRIYESRTVQGLIKEEENGDTKD